MTREEWNSLKTGDKIKNSRGEIFDVLGAIRGSKVNHLYLSNENGRLESVKFENYEKVTELPKEVEG